MTKSHLFNWQNSPMAKATCKNVKQLLKMSKQYFTWILTFKNVEMEEEKSCKYLFLIGVSRAPVPDCHKVDFFFIRQLHLVNINLKFLLQILECRESTRARIVPDLVFYAVANIACPIQRGWAGEKWWNGQNKKNQCSHHVRKVSTLGSRNFYILNNLISGVIWLPLKSCFIM